MIEPISPRPSSGVRAIRAACVVALLSLSIACSQGATELVGLLEAAEGHPLAPLLVIVAFVASGFVAAPLSLVMIPTIVVFGLFVDGFESGDTLAWSSTVP